ncbi:Acetyl-coenzyme A carboxylase carboxyl transferase subunit alpha [Sinobacterium norvegicum]|uniref:Acetyl-coenzyme A carboxylase carboxyl transferase subunit alpha n=1 Tax=Sinobacterium norvegicum TaxID=1641715 RepID=A0ABN8EDY0_9GAMM|nr:acyl-CoA carboxylase subunit beta [Sinobacterium norvegicum]CAH0990553.1 Acetyl-coenzyme A carboxylase carboxyl transferase subunit alpha [Sinobacterium norvegicum]
MAVIETQLDNQSEQFHSNAAVMASSTQAFRDIEQRVIDAAEAKAPRYIKKGLLPPRERLSQLLDAGAPFLELSTLCGYMQEDDTDGSAAGGGCISGIGYVSGTRCMVMVDDYLTKGGSISQLGSTKRQRMMEIALDNKLPLVTLAQSGGGNLQQLGDWFAFSGAGFATQAKLSAAGIPQITVVHGSATAGGAYQPGLSDYVIMIRKQSTVYLAGPPLLKAATGEIATDEEIGGAEMHSEVAGTADYLAENDADGIRIAREVTAKLGWPGKVSNTVKTDYLEPAYGAQELLGVVPEDAKVPYDVREIIGRIGDGSDFVDFKADYDIGTVCGHIDMQGYPCGVIGNNGPITANGAAKAGQFVQLCEQSGTPILFLHNTTGFLVGTESEQAGIIKHGAKLIQAVTNATVPKISVVVGGSYGAGNYAMCGRGIGPRFMFAWPRTVVSVMGPPQAGSVMRTIAAAKMARAGKVDEAMLDGLEQQTITSMESKSHALANTARLWDDGIIDPRDTRAIIGFVLSVCREADQRCVNSNNFGIARF